MKPERKLTLADLFDNPSDDFILDDDGVWDDPEEDEPLPEGFRLLTADDWAEIQDQS
jgi:hypothetical protein